jgi:cyclase
MERGKTPKAFKSSHTAAYSTHSPIVSLQCRLSADGRQYAFSGFPLATSKLASGAYLPRVAASNPPASVSAKSPKGVPLFKRMLVSAVALPFVALSCLAETAAKSTYQTVRISEGITAFIASESNTGVVSGNCVAVVGEDGVLVVDSTNFPSHARRIIAEIKQMTPKPVRYVVHTHWHPDHLMGDGEFRTAFPGVTFVTTSYTQRAIVDFAPKYIKETTDGGVAYGVTLRKQAQDGKDETGKALTPGEKKIYNDFANALDFVVPEYKQAKLVPPDLGFEKSLTVRLGAREVQLLFLGRGNTGGDTVIFVPDARVVMTGDLLVAPTPYSFGSYLTEWVQTLDKVKALGAKVIVPGHGPVEHDNSYIDLVSAALQSVTSQVQQAVKKGLSLEDTRKQVDLSAFERKFAGDDSDRQIAFRLGFVEPAVERAFQETKFSNED